METFADPVRRPIARTAAAVVVAAGLALVAAACSTSSGSHVAHLGSTTTQTTTSSTAASAQANGTVAFAHCMRSKGVANYPDPTSSGLVKESLQQLAVGSSRFRSASSACNHLLANGGRPPDQAARQQIRARGLTFSRCIRSHGVPRFPDPGSDGRVPDPATVGIDQGSPKFRAANQACRKYRPPYMPSNAAFNAYARTQSGS